MSFFDCIVVGGGHAGVEASYSASKLKCKTLLITLNISNISKMYCNPSIGGTAKGVVVKEVDSLGGLIGNLADKASMQLKNLNASKGPAVQSLRSQSDKEYYSKVAYETLKETPNLTILEDKVIDIIIKEKKIVGVVTENNGTFTCVSLVLTTGTFLNSQVLVGHTSKISGPDFETTTFGISDFFKKNNIDIIRLKTGTPPRIDINSIDYSKLEVHFGDSMFELKYGFSGSLVAPASRACFLVYTNEHTHTIIRNNLQSSAMYSGLITGVGPRYCPSIEDKIVRFSDKERHQLFVEPESHKGDTVYLQGFSTSMPHNIQEEMVHSLIGFENAKIVKYAYAIEYDAINPINLKHTLELKNIEGLFCAGQINGTSGYEEAAGQGIIAGINAANKVLGNPPFILNRNEAYIGVMIDDLVTKGVTDPYRLFSSRAEYRMYIRSDNSNQRLLEKGYQLGLVEEERYLQFKKKEILVERIINFSSKTAVNYIENGINKTEKISVLLSRPEYTFNKIDSRFCYIDSELLKQAEIEIKYSGYINKEKREILRLEKQENILLSSEIDYKNIKDLSLEARDKLNKIKPINIGQALRIPGISLADITVLLIHLQGIHKNGHN